MAKKLGATATKVQMGGGIDALFGGKKKIEEAIAENPAAAVKELARHFAMIPIAQIERNPDQPRVDFDPTALDELADSIKLHGIIQPITVRFLEPGRYQLISGERRWRASKLAELEEVPAYIRTADDQTLLEMAIIENIQREDLNAMEIATSYQRLKEECKFTDDQLAERVGKKRATVTNYLRLLRMHIAVQDALKKDLITAGHAKVIAGLDDILMQKVFLDDIVAKKWSVRHTESVADDYRTVKKAKTADEATEKAAPRKKKTQEEIELDKMQADFKAFFGNGKLKINVEDKNSGNGHIFIPFSDYEQLTELFKCIEIL